MKLTKRCYACRQMKPFFLIKRRSFVFPKASALPIISNDELCGDCFKRIKEGVFAGLTDNNKNNGQTIEG